MLLLMVFILFSLRLSYGNHDIRILSGVLANNRNYPYQLSLEEMEYGSFQHKCGAVIIGRTWALTAAHCVYGKAPHDYRLRSGSKFLGEGDIHQVKQVIPHQQFSMETHQYDIALLKVKQPFKRSKTKRVRIIPLAKETPEPGSIGTIIGWGKMTMEGYGSSFLAKAKVFIVDSIICQYEYTLHVITEDMLCAAALNYGKDSCQGDSGGPLVVNNTLAGIISWAEGCGQEYKPGINANVAFLREWIITSILKHS